MKYTKDDLAKMSDFEVNKNLQALLGFDVSGISEDQNMMTGAIKSFCSESRLTTPLLIDYRLALLPLKGSGSWSVTNNAESYITDSSYRFNEEGGVSYSSSNPQRAIACCLILVLQDK